MKHFRFSDRHDLIKDSPDFTIRRRTKAQQVYVMFLMAIVIVMGVTTIVYNEALLAAGTVTVAGGVMFYVARQYEKMGRQVVAAEFMNAMFASALGMHCKFCLVAKPDGEIIYIDRGFQSTFLEFSAEHARSLQALFSLYQVDAANQQKIIAAVSNRASETVNFFIIVGQDKVPQPIQLIIEPIPHPKGFILLRGKAV